MYILLKVRRGARNNHGGPAFCSYEKVSDPSAEKGASQASPRRRNN